MEGVNQSSDALFWRDVFLPPPRDFEVEHGESAAKNPTDDTQEDGGYESEYVHGYVVCNQVENSVRVVERSKVFEVPRIIILESSY